MIEWATFTFPPLNLLVVWPSPEMVKANTELNTYDRSMNMITIDKYRLALPPATAPRPSGTRRLRELYPLNTLTRGDYDSVREAGMLYVYYPEATGDYEEDIKVGTGVTTQEILDE